MLPERRTRTDTKAIRRKINEKMQTIVRKSVELAQNSCEVLLIIQYSASKQWIQYSSSDASSLFFGFENAKKHLQQVEEYNNANVHKFVSDLTEKTDSYSPSPAKHLKTIENNLEIPQSLLLKPEKCSKISQGEASTYQSSLSSQYLYTGKSTIPPEKTGESKPSNTQRPDENSSPEFSFEDYFAFNES